MNDIEKNRNEIIEQNALILKEYFNYCDSKKIYELEKLNKIEFSIPESGIQQSLLKELIISGSRNILSSYEELHMFIGYTIGSEIVSKKLKMKNYPTT